MWAFIQNLGLPELLVVLTIVLLLFGARRLPEIARSIGKSLQAFKKGVQEDGRDESQGNSSDDRTPPAS